MTNETIPNNSEILKDIFNVLPQITEQHAPSTQLHQLLKKIVRKEIEPLFSQENGKQSIQLDPFGEIVFPYHKMGAIDSLNLFDLDECIIFSFYWLNRDRYKKVLDIGANLGLHSIIMSLCGWNVTAYEPDPTHFRLLSENLSLNNISTVEGVNSAISVDNGAQEFIRVLGNTTGSHLAGSKENPYGELDKFSVTTQSFKELIQDVDFIKMDVEGHEKGILLSTSREDWLNTDALVEVENPDNAQAIFDHFQSENINLFSQKCNWGQVKSVSDLPVSYKEGMVFISTNDEMPWGN